MTCTCGKPTRDNAYVCDTCTNEFQQALAETPWLTAQLDLSMTRAKGVDYRAKGGTKGGSKETALPVDYGAYAAASKLRAALLTWVKHCHDTAVPHQSPKTGLPILETAAMSRWLMWRIDGLSLSPDGPVAMGDITSAVAHGRRVIDRPADKWFAGPCNGTIGDDECGRDMYVTPGKPQVTCPACKSIHDVAARRTWLLEAAQDSLATATEIARAVTVLGEGGKSTKTLVRLMGDWNTAGRLTERGHTMRRGQARPLYRVGDVVELVEAHMAREQAKRLPA